MRLIFEPIPDLDPQYLYVNPPQPDVVGIELEGQQDALTLIRNLFVLAAAERENILDRTGYGQTPGREAGRLAVVLTDELAKASGDIGAMSYKAPDADAARALHAAYLVSGSKVEAVKQPSTLGYHNIFNAVLSDDGVSDLMSRIRVSGPNVGEVHDTPLAGTGLERIECVDGRRPSDKPLFDRALFGKPENSLPEDIPKIFLE